VQTNDEKQLKTTAKFVDSRRVGVSYWWSFGKLEPCLYL